jgi:predicted transcriptional regulator
MAVALPLVFCNCPWYYTVSTDTYFFSVVECHNKNVDLRKFYLTLLDEGGVETRTVPSYNKYQPQGDSIKYWTENGDYATPDNYSFTTRYFKNPESLYVSNRSFKIIAYYEDTTVSSLVVDSIFIKEAYELSMRFNIGKAVSYVPPGEIRKKTMTFNGVIDTVFFTYP